MSKTISYGTFSYRNIFRVSLPIMISLVMEQLIGMTDTVFLGRVGEVELGASALAGVFYISIYMIGFGFSLGVQILIGRSNGEGDYKATGKAFWQGLYFLLFLAIVTCCLFEILAGPIMNLAVSSEHVREAALKYVRWRLPSLLFSYCTVMYRAFYIGTTKTSSLTLNGIVMVLSNVFFNWTLIFGKFGLPALGIEGAAIGSTLAEFVSLLFFCLHTRFRFDIDTYGMRIPAAYDPALMRSIMKISFWTMIQSFVSIATWLLFFLFIEHTGERPLAISNIIRSTSGLIWMILSAFASTACTLVSNLIGEGRQDAVLSVVKRIVKLSYLVITPLLILFCLFPEAILSIYTDMADLRLASVPSLLVMCASYILTIPATVCFQSVSGTGRTKTAFRLELVALVIYVLFCVVVIEILRSDVAICWLSEAVYAIVIFTCSALYLRTGRWKAN